MNVQKKPPLRVVPAAQANRQFSELLRAVAQGESVLITSRGKPVATLAPPDLTAEDHQKAEKDRLFREYLDELKQRPLLHLGKFNRDDAYD